MPVFDEEHEHEHEEQQSDVDPLHSVADSVHSAHSVDQGAMESSGTYDMDSLDGDVDHDEAEPHYAQIAKKQQQDSAHANDHEDKEEDVGGKVNGHHMHRTNSNLVIDHHNDGDNDSGAGEGHNEHEAAEHQQQHSTSEEEGEIPLSQAPNWDLLI